MPKTREKNVPNGKERSAQPCLILCRWSGPLFGQHLYTLYPMNSPYSLQVEWSSVWPDLYTIYPMNSPHPLQVEWSIVWPAFVHNVPNELTLFSAGGVVLCLASICTQCINELTLSSAGGVVLCLARSVHNVLLNSPYPLLVEWSFVWSASGIACWGWPGWSGLQEDMVIVKSSHSF